MLKTNCILRTFLKLINFSKKQSFFKFGNKNYKKWEHTYMIQWLFGDTYTYTRLHESITKKSAEVTCAHPRVQV